MVSDIYKACAAGDIDFLKVLIETSPPGLNINLLEPNGDTPLHIACEKGHFHIVKMLLHECKVDPNQLNIDNRTADEVTSNDNICQLFQQVKKTKSRFSTDENSANPLQVIQSENPSKSHWLQHYPCEAPILTQLYYDVLDEQRVPLTGIINIIRSAFGNDPEKKKIEQWSNHIQSLIDRSLITSPSTHRKASKLLEKFKNTNDIKHLLKLYTLSIDFTQFIGKDLDNTICFYAPIKKYLYHVEDRAYQGESYRGLTMTKQDFYKYVCAYENKGSYIGTNTFCSTSLDRVEAEGFAAAGDTSNDKIKVLIKFHFPEQCSTAIILYAKLPYFEAISVFNDELEVLIFPGTIFSVANIQPDNQNQLATITLQRYDTDEQQAEMAQERFKSYINSFFLVDSMFSVDDLMPT